MARIKTGDVYDNIGHACWNVEKWIIIIWKSQECFLFSIICESGNEKDIE